MRGEDILCWRDTFGSLFISAPRLSIKIAAKGGCLSICDLTSGERTAVESSDIASFSVSEAHPGHQGHLTLMLNEESATKYGFFVKSLTWGYHSPINKHINTIKKYIKSLNSL